MIQVIAPLIITALPPPAPPKWESRYRCQPARVKVLGRYWNWKTQSCDSQACRAERAEFARQWKVTRLRSGATIDLSGVNEFLEMPSDLKQIADVKQEPAL